MKTTDVSVVPEVQREEKVRAVLVDAVQAGIAGLSLKAEVSHHASGATIVVHVNRYESFDLSFEMITGDVIFARARRRIIAVGNLWDGKIEEKIAATIDDVVSRELHRMSAARAATVRAA